MPNEKRGEVIPLPQGIERAKRLLKTDSIPDVIEAFRKDPLRFKFLLDQLSYEFISWVYIENLLFSRQELELITDYIQQKAEDIPDPDK